MKYLVAAVICMIIGAVGAQLNADGPNGITGFIYHGITLTEDVDFWFQDIIGGGGKYWGNSNTGGLKYEYFACNESGPPPCSDLVIPMDHEYYWQGNKGALESAVMGPFWYSESTTYYYENMYLE